MLTSTSSIPEVVDLLEWTAERLRSAAGRDGTPAEEAARTRRLADDLSSHALAARVLVTTGASSEALDRVIGRAMDLVDRHTSTGVVAGGRSAS